MVEACRSNASTIDEVKIEGHRSHILILIVVYFCHNSFTHPMGHSRTRGGGDGEGPLLGGKGGVGLKGASKQTIKVKTPW